MERTFGMIKPNLVAQNLIGKVVTIIEESGLKIVEARMERLTPEKAKGFYAEHKERPFFNGLIEFMTSGPVLLMALEGEHAVERYRKLMGATDPAKAAPGTIRKLFGEDIEKNGVHGSDSSTSANRELMYFFG